MDIAELEKTFKSNDHHIRLVAENRNNPNANKEVEGYSNSHLHVMRNNMNSFAYCITCFINYMNAASAEFDMEFSTERTLKLLEDIRYKNMTEPYMHRWNSDSDTDSVPRLLKEFSKSYNRLQRHISKGHISAPVLEVLEHLDSMWENAKNAIDYGREKYKVEGPWKYSMMDEDTLRLAKIELDDSTSAS